MRSSFHTIQLLLIYIKIFCKENFKEKKSKEKKRKEKDQIDCVIVTLSERENNVAFKSIILVCKGYF